MDLASMEKEFPEIVHYARVYRRGLQWEGPWEALEARTKKPSKKQKKTKKTKKTIFWKNLGWGLGAGKVP